jgi:hypothetical protein
MASAGGEDRGVEKHLGPLTHLC